VYHWESEEAMRQLIGMPVHEEAKSAHERWIGPYRVVIAEVLTTYGQPGLGLDHVPVRSA
jgi:heme-degrading monooxygenase HmoA